MTQSQSQDPIRPDVHQSRVGDVLVIEIDNPPINAGSQSVREGPMEAIATLQSDARLSAAVLIGAHNTFIAGSDLREFGKPLAAPQLPAVLSAIENCCKPIVAALSGAALGGGFELALACDARIALAKTVVGLPEVTLGIIPGAGGTQRLPRAIGKSKAMDLALTSRMMDAAEAERAGLVSRVVPLDKLMDEALGAALQICSFSQIATVAAKESVNRSFEGTLADGIMFERRMFHSMFATQDQKEGMDAFLSKRQPTFKNL